MLLSVYMILYFVYMYVVNYCNFPAIARANGLSQPAGIWSIIQHGGTYVAYFYKLSHLLFPIFHELFLQ